MGSVMFLGICATLLLKKVRNFSFSSCPAAFQVSVRESVSLGILVPPTVEAHSFGYFSPSAPRWAWIS